MHLLMFVALPFDAQRVFAVIRFLVAGLLLIATLNICSTRVSYSVETVPNKATAKKFGIEKRVPWTTSHVVGSPEPPDPYRVEVAFSKLNFSQPLCIERIPNTDKFVVAERLGKLFLFENQRDVEARLLMDVGRTVYGLAFHPKFAENGLIYVTSILDPATPEPQGSRLSRYKLKSREPLVADPASEEMLLEWPSGGHNGGNIQFGPDGFLYLVTGDGSGIADSLETGQDLSDLLASMLRIDVDHQDQGLKYAIPKDNPFVGQKDARGEIWAYGLRQAWKFRFDPAGNLWAGEVGQDLWEEVLLIEKGGNYGWSVQESNHPFRPERPKGPSPILAPVVEHHHVDFRSVTGGWIYNGSRLPELRGAYIYGDYDTGKIWILGYVDGQVKEHRELADTQLRIIDFGQDAQGEVLILDFMGRIYQLTPAPPVSKEIAPFPRKLSETGLFANTKHNQPAPGVIPYSVNAQLWSDGAKKERFLALPGTEQIEFDTVLYPQGAPGALPGWRFPDGTVLVKTFALEMEKGNPASLRKLETRLLHYEAIPGNEEVGAQVWHGYTYLWNEDQTDAELLEKGGADRTYTIKDASVEGGERKQTWHFPSRAECALCHNMSAKYALGVTTQQMNRDHDYDGVVANQLDTLDHIGVFTAPLPKPVSELPTLADYADPHATIDTRARSYLQANCAHCHRKWGGGNAEFQLLSTLPLAETGTVNGPLGQGTFDLKNPKLLVPGNPDRSMILYRMQKTGLGRMPHIASNVVDTEAVEIVRKWIEEME